MSVRPWPIRAMSMPIATTLLDRTTVPVTLDTLEMEETALVIKKILFLVFSLTYLFNFVSL